MINNGVKLKMNEIFNFKETRDIPDSLLKQINIFKIREDSQKLFHLFKLKQKLSIDEVLIGLYRLYGIQKTRVWVSSTLYNLSRKKLVKKVEGENGTYKIGDETDFSRKFLKD